MANTPVQALNRCMANILLCRKRASQWALLAGNEMITAAEGNETVSHPRLGGMVSFLIQVLIVTPVIVTAFPSGNSADA